MPDNQVSARASSSPPVCSDMDIDPLSGRTCPRDNPWIYVLRKRLATQPPPNRQADATAKSTTSRNPPPRLPQDQYTIVYRPRTGLNVSAWTPRSLSHSIAAASRIPQQEFYDKVVIQVQSPNNLIVACTPDPEHAITLSAIQSIRLGEADYEIQPYMKPPPNTSRGVIHGLDPEVTNETLQEMLQANKPLLLHARLMGRTTSALLTFDGPHVPFYVKVGSILYRCRPFRRSVQVCRLCGELGHRQDVCPNPDRPKCIDCGLNNPASDHQCAPKCKLCNQPHTTAGKDCPRRLIPTIPKATTARHTTTQGPSPQKVSWSAIVANAPTAPEFPPLSVRTPATQPLHTQPAPELTQLLKEIKQQNADFQKRIVVLETAVLRQPCPPPVSEPPQTFVEEKVLPQVVSLITESTQFLNKLITDTAEHMLGLINQIASRLAALENRPHQEVLLPSLESRITELETSIEKTHKKPRQDGSQQPQMTQCADDSPPSL